MLAMTGLCNVIFVIARNKVTKQSAIHYLLMEVITMPDDGIVLVVDDEKTIVNIMEAYLSKAGYKVMKAYNGEDALRMVSEFNPDIILLDIMMPGINGYEVTRRLKENKITNIIPVILVTGLDSVDDKVKGLDAGADDFITKPVNKIELLARVKSLIKLKRLQEEFAESARLSNASPPDIIKDSNFQENIVLIADGNKIAAKHLKDVLDSAGYECIAAGSGEDAFNSLGTKIPDVVLLDTTLPDSDGIELLKRFRENPATEDISIILISNDGGTETKVKGLEKGADDYLVRPVNQTEMLARIKASLRRSRARQRLKLQAEVFFKQSITDSLTGLYNSRYLADIMQRQIKLFKRHKRSFSVMMLDIDYFKGINDTFGHVTGDGVLQEFGKVLKENIRGSDIVSRYGGEEFVVLLSNTNIEGAGILAERIRSRVEGYMFPGIGNRKITVSIGISEVGSEDDASAIMKKVDDALYMAKKNGRNIVKQC